VEGSLADNSGYFVSGVAGALTAPRLCSWLSEPPAEYAPAKIRHRRPAPGRCDDLGPYGDRSPAKRHHAPKARTALQFLPRFPKQALRASRRKGTQLIFVFIFQMVMKFFAQSAWTNTSSRVHAYCRASRCTRQNAFAYTLCGKTGARALPPERLSL
jgi:hypothetical protein